MALRDKLIEEAEAYERAGEALPLDLYSALLREGIDASLYNQIDEQTDEEK